MRYSQRFYQHLKDYQITEFTTKDVAGWYLYNRRGTNPHFYSDLYNSILQPLIWQGLVERTSLGCYKRK